MKPVHIFRHVTCEGPGYFADYLERQQIPYEIIRVDQGQPVPSDYENASGLVFMGGNMSVNDPLKWVDDELRLIRAAHKNDIPTLGFCLGAQLISKALGGSVAPGGKGMEIGWREVNKTTQDPQWASMLPDSFTPFHWHGETFTLPDDAEHLFASDCFANQAFACRNSLALQFHPELTADMIREWLELYQADIKDDAPCSQRPEAILTDIDERVSAARQVADILFDNWCRRLDNFYGHG